MLRRENEALRDRLSGLSEASLRISRSLDVDTVLQGVIDGACSLTKARYGALVAFDDSGGIELQLRFRPGDMFAQHNVTLQVQDDENTELVFPVSLVERAETFDALMGDVAEAIETGDDPAVALDDNHITDPKERQTLEKTVAAMQRLHSDGRNHIWAYYTRNLVRPVALSQAKVDVIVGNPPWLIYRNTANTLRTELERQSKDVYGIWVGGRHANHQDISSLFFARSVDLYLRDGGVIGMVMPHSALQTGQHSKWRTGAWQTKPSGSGRNRTPGRVLAVDFSHKTPWDLEGLEPNTFFPVPASVVFARRTGEDGKATPLAGEAERWLGGAGTERQQTATNCHNRHLGHQCFALCRLFPTGGVNRSTLPVLCGRDREPCHRSSRPNGHRECEAWLTG